MQTGEGSPCDLSTPFSKQSTPLYQSSEAQWEGDDDSKMTPPKKGSFKKRLTKMLWWCVDPTHALLIWMFLTLEAAVFTWFLAKIGAIGSDTYERSQMEYGAKRTLYFIIVLKMLSLHPSRAVWLYQWAFKAEGDRAYFDEAFPFAPTWPKLTWLILILTHIAFCSQYFWWLSTYIWIEGAEPRWASILPWVLGPPGLAAGILQAVLARMHLRKQANGADLKSMKTFDEITAKTRELPSEWRVKILVERPGQEPLEFDTVGSTTALLAKV